MRKTSGGKPRVSERGISMRKTTMFQWTCPKCGKKELVLRPIVLDADAMPEAAGDVREDRYFRVRCSACGETQDFLMHMLYADRTRRFLVALQPDEKTPLSPVPAEALREGWRLRLVRDSEDLADKVRALESAIDDRLIAVAEYLLYRKIRPAMPAGSVMGMTVFHEGDGGPEVLLPMEIAEKGYAMGKDALTAARLAELESAYGKALAEDRETGFREIGRAWAAAFVESQEK